MSWITDNPWPLVLIFVAGAVLSLLIGFSRSRTVALLCVLAAVGVYLLEQSIISPSERVQAQVEQMLQHFKARDADAIAAMISDDAEELADVARQGLDLVEVSDSFHIKSAVVTVDDSEQTAEALVRANGNLQLLKHGGGSRYVPTYWNMTWRKTNDAWKLAQVIRLNPANGQEIGILSAQ
ncbi:MAG: hypothetical protein Fues2KO_34960 [Fuerstiella sp.]